VGFGLGSGYGSGWTPPWVPITRPVGKPKSDRETISYTVICYNCIYKSHQFCNVVIIIDFCDVVIIIDIKELYYLIKCCYDILRVGFSAIYLTCGDRNTF
jgi:hypothetical protein